MGLEARAEGRPQPLTPSPPRAASHPRASPVYPVEPLQLTATRGRSHTPFLDPLAVEAGVAGMRLSPGRGCLCPGSSGPPISPPDPHPHPHPQREETKSQKAQARLSSMELAVKQGREGHVRLTFPERCLVKHGNPWPSPTYHPHKGGAEAARKRLGPGARLGRGTKSQAPGWSGVPREQHRTGSQGWASGGKGRGPRAALGSQGPQPGAW